MKLWRGIALVGGLAILIAVLILAASPVKLNGQEKQGKSGTKGGFVLSDDATASDVGLPIYPGAREYQAKSGNDDSPAVQMGLWGGSSGFKLVVLKLESNDSPANIANFYRKALARYGKVLDCGKSAGKAEKSGSLDCDSDQPAAGSFTLKSGTKAKQHIVGVEPEGAHTKISLVYLQAPPNDKEN
ncbi:MAG TPA: hypothetical protein VKW06_11245 [Candidatus Angelobacter sp.]|nr:hypothetical protein [Candidatus Angelobacter sp.]